MEKEEGKCLISRSANPTDVALQVLFECTPAFSCSWWSFFSCYSLEHIYPTGLRVPLFTFCPSYFPQRKSIFSVNSSLKPSKIFFFNFHVLGLEPDCKGLEPQNIFCPNTSAYEEVHTRNTLATEEQAIR